MDCRSRAWGFLSVALLPSLALASNKISSPNIEKGRLGIEYRGGYDFDDSTAQDEAQLHKFVMNYGITDRLRPELKVLYSDSYARDARVSGLELSLMMQIFKPKEAWLATSFESYYKPSFIHGLADRLEEKLLVEKDTALFIHNAYITWEKEIGADERGSYTLTAAGKTRYKYQAYLQPGVEIYADLNRLDGDNRVQIGPLIAGKIGQFTYETGYLFSTNNAAPDGRFKIIAGYAWHF
jgi:hypothetical protein